METCRGNVHNFITLMLVNADKRFVMSFSPRTPSELNMIGDPRVPLLEFWADRGHFQSIHHDRIPRNFFLCFRRMVTQDLTTYDQNRESVIHSADGDSRRSIWRNGLIPGFTNRQDSSRKRMSIHFAAVEYQMRVHGFTTLKEKEWYFVFNLDRWIQEGRAAFITPSGTVLVNERINLSLIHI